MLKEKEEYFNSELKKFILESKGKIIFNDNIIDLDFLEISEFNPKLSDMFLETGEECVLHSSRIFSSMGFGDNIKVHIKNYPNKYKINEIRAIGISQLISTKGIIKRITKVIPRTQFISFECPSCSSIFSLVQTTKQTKEPTRCTCGRKGGFRKLSEDILDIQELNLEETPEELEGRTPQQIRVYLENELTSKDFNQKLQPGRKIEVIGVVKKLPAFMHPKDEEQNISEFMIHANNIIPLESDDDFCITVEDIEQIKSISSNNPLKFLSDNLAPEIYGNNVVKRAIILQMMKGVSKEKSDGNLSKEDIHILLCGDPGIAKSVLCQAVVARTPKCRMIVGTKTSRTAISAMAVKDDLLGSWSLEAGALVLCSSSLCCVDEVDKLDDDAKNDLLEPMSMSTVTINKAGISAKLPARTSVLATANPIRGSYDMEQPMGKQIDLSQPILNRFDLIFILIDRPNKDFDVAAVDHIFQSFKQKRVTEITPEFFKKYITYCRKLKPQLKDDLKEELQRFYVSMRTISQNDKVKGIPINLRNIEGIIRLAEAHAKLRLSEWVEKKDLEVAEEIFMFCLKQVGIDNETGLVDMSRIDRKVPVSKRYKVETLLSVMHQLQEKHGIVIPYDSIKEAAIEKEIKLYEVSDYLDELKKQGKIYEPKNGFYSLL